jgi:hypothetical protein
LSIFYGGSLLSGVVFVTYLLIFDASNHMCVAVHQLFGYRSHMVVASAPPTSMYRQLQ